MWCSLSLLFFFFNDTATTEIYTLSLHDALPIYQPTRHGWAAATGRSWRPDGRSEEHTSELQSPVHIVCRLLLEKKKTNTDQFETVKKKITSIEERKTSLDS